MNTFNLIKASLLALALCCLAPAHAGPDDVVGMVLDIQGGGEIARKGDVRKLQLLGYLKPGARVTVEPGAKVSLSHYGAKLIYTVAGPATVQVDQDKLASVKGSAPTSRSLAEKVVVAALNPNMGAAAFKMRGPAADIRLVSPASQTVLIGIKPSFLWEAAGKQSYQVTVVEKPERHVAQGSTESAMWTLPENVILQAGGQYRWTVSYTGADGKLRSASADFSVASEADASTMLTMRPLADAAVDEWVLYASLLRDRNMFEASREVWRAIAAKRPDLAIAQSMAR